MPLTVGHPVYIVEGGLGPVMDHKDEVHLALVFLKHWKPVLGYNCYKRLLIDAINLHLGCLLVY